MSHGITEYDSMFSTGKVPWHGLGKRLPALATKEEAIEASELGWGVKTVPVLAQVNGHSTQIPGFVATVRDTDNLVLGVVKEGYKVFQNETLFEFARALVDTDEAVFETAGSLFGGKIVWVLLKLPENIILPRDGGTILPYMLGFTSHDGSKAMSVRPTPIRVECANTLGMAERANRAAYVVRHTRFADPMQKIIAAQEAMGFTFRWYEHFQKSAETLIRQKMTVKDLTAFTVALFPNAKGEDEQTATRTQNRRDAVIALARNTENLAGVRGTAWAAYNAVAEYVDHQTTYHKTANSREENRAASILDGSAYALKTKALDLLTAKN